MPHPASLVSDCQNAKNAHHTQKLKILNTLPTLKIDNTLNVLPTLLILPPRRSAFAIITPQPIITQISVGVAKLVSSVPNPLFGNNANLASMRSRFCRGGSRAARAHSIPPCFSPLPEFGTNEVRRGRGGRAVLNHHIRAILPEHPAQCVTNLSERHIMLDTLDQQRHQVLISLRRPFEMRPQFIDPVVIPVRPQCG